MFDMNNPPFTTAALNAIRQAPPVSTVGQIAYRTGMGAIIAKRAVDELIETGKIIRNSSGVYQINQEAAA